ncbi:uncharacterized protein BJX67DRAFT_228919 [Aspergillus lucknowensis]|uniref:Uncharacterized protein n=1 Tax=Aspergillus lucknowensis TaxID=176173 RepID=A0ABR4LIL9_9EURO
MRSAPSLVRVMSRGRTRAMRLVNKSKRSKSSLRDDRVCVNHQGEEPLTKAQEGSGHVPSSVADSVSRDITCQGWWRTKSNEIQRNHLQDDEDPRSIRYQVQFIEERFNKSCERVYPRSLDRSESLGKEGTAVHSAPLWGAATAKNGGLPRALHRAGG